MNITMTSAIYSIDQWSFTVVSDHLDLRFSITNIAYVGAFVFIYCTVNSLIPLLNYTALLHTVNKRVWTCSVTHPVYTKSCLTIKPSVPAISSSAFSTDGSIVFCNKGYSVLPCARINADMIRPVCTRHPAALSDSYLSIYHSESGNA